MTPIELAMALRADAIDAIEDGLGVVCVDPSDLLGLCIACARNFRDICRREAKKLGIAL